MNHNSSFDERFNAELNKRLGIQPNTSVGDLTPDELTSAESLLNLAKNLNQAPVPTLSAASKARIESVLHAQVLAQTPQPARIRRFTRWQFVAASLALILSVSGVFAMWDAYQKDDGIQVTTLHQDTAVQKVSPSPTEQLPTMTATEDFALNTPNPETINDVTLSVVVVCENDTNYWQNNLANWAVSSLTIGNRDYVQADLVTILETPTESDASLVLAKSLIIAYLNGRSDLELAEANILLEGYSGKLPFEIDVTSAVGRAMLETASNLEAITTDCETPTPSPDSVGGSDSNNNQNNGNASPDTCKNPPPDHANAQGWRERCENGGGNNNGNNGNGNKK